MKTTYFNKRDRFTEVEFFTLDGDFSRLCQFALFMLNQSARGFVAIHSGNVTHDLMLSSDGSVQSIVETR